MSEDGMEGSATATSVAGGVAIGQYVLDVTPPTGAALATPPAPAAGAARERARLRRAIAQDDKEEKRRRGPVDYVESATDRLDAGTEQVERADALWEDLAAGRLKLGDVAGELDTLLAVLQKLDRDGRFDEQLRLARSLCKLLAIALRWLDLLRALRGLLMAAERHRDVAAKAWALHQRGTLYLTGDHLVRADDALSEARQLREEIGDARGLAATERVLALQCRTLRRLVRERRLVENRGWRRLLYASHAAVLIIGGLIFGGATAAIASGLLSGGSASGAVPVVSQVSPDSGPAAGGTVLTITGSGFRHARRVVFGDPRDGLRLRILSDTRLEVTTPPGAGTETVTVLTASGRSRASSLARFTYTAVPPPPPPPPPPAAPSVSSVSPSRGGATGKTLVTIAGTGLAHATRVLFGAAPGSSLRVLSASRLEVVTPPGTGKVAVTVVAPAGSSPANAAAQFTYIAAPPPPPPPAPTIKLLKPNTGPSVGKTTVTIIGTGLAHVTAVMFGSSQAANLDVLSDTQLQVVSPPGSGTVAVTAVAPSGDSNAMTFTYQSPPTISQVSPTTVVAGGSVTLTGSGLLGASQATWTDANQNVIATYSNLAPTSDTSLTVPAPPASNTGAGCPAGGVSLYLTVTTPTGTASAPSPVTWMCAPPPTLG